EVSLYRFRLVKIAGSPNEDKIRNLTPSPKDLGFIIFTSGSTGSPKGVEFTHENIVSAVSVPCNEQDFWKNGRYFAYLPQAHIFEYIAATVICTHGLEIGFGHPLSLYDTSPMIIPGIREDLAALQPTFFSAGPLFLERTMKDCFDMIDELPMHKKIVFQEAFNEKLRVLKTGIEPSRALEKILLMYVCFGTIKQGYGLTETSCAGALLNFNYWRIGNVGPVAKYDSQGPRGEILLSGKCISTAIRIIDRKKDIFKLNQGGYVSLAQIEQSLMQNILLI
ncbi:hypothetical protein HZS_4100, partial [Henneguya salminicola]